MNNGKYGSCSRMWRESNRIRIVGCAHRLPHHSTRFKHSDHRSHRTLFVFNSSHLKLTADFVLIYIRSNALIITNNYCWLVLRRPPHRTNNISYCTNGCRIRGAHNFLFRVLPFGYRPPLKMNFGRQFNYTFKQDLNCVIRKSKRERERAAGGERECEICILVY